jgi:hypothetical protein
MSPAAFSRRCPATFNAFLSKTLAAITASPYSASLRWVSTANLANGASVPGIYLRQTAKYFSFQVDELTLIP